METNDFSNSPLIESNQSQRPPRISIRTMLRLGLFQMGLGIMSILTLGLLNRIMIKELGITPTLVAVVLAIPYFVAPARVWFGQLSDSKPLLGHHRTGYVWMGVVLMAFISFLAVQTVWQLGNSFQFAGCSIQGAGWNVLSNFLSQPGCAEARIWAVLLALVFGLYGLAVSASSTPFAALLVDVSEEDNRSQLAGIVWAMLLAGTVLAAGGIFGSLSKLPLDAPLEALQAAVSRLFLVIPLIVIVLAFVATLGVEKKYSRYTSRSVLLDREDKITLGRAWKILTASPQTGLFFTFLIVMTMGLFMQDAVMEAYGGDIFKMKVSETTLLNAFFGGGTMIGMVATGFLIVPRLGKQKTARLGCLMVALCTMLIAASGLTQNPKFLQAALFMFGLASGITTTGAISLMLDLTAAETAGTFIGAWGLAQAWARGIAVTTGGILLDLGKTLFQVPVLSYGLVFVVEGGAMLLAVWFLSRVNVQEFLSNAKEAITTVLQSELD